MEELHIVFATDKAYLGQTCVAIQSVLTASEINDRAYCFYVLMPFGETEMASPYFTEIENQNRHCTIQVIGIQKDFGNASIVMKHITLPTYYRLLLPDLIQQEKCIYLDSDIIVCRDLSELYDIDMEGYDVGGVFAPAYVKDQDYCNKIGIPCMDQYINAGVLLCNLKQMRKENFTKRGLELVGEPFPAQDQDIINKLCYGKIKLLPFKFNLQTLRLNLGKEVLEKIFSESELEEAKENPSIIHYLTEKKPWEWLDVNYADRWWEICKGTEFCREFMTKYQFSFYYYGIITHKKLWNLAVYTDEWYQELKKYSQIYLYGAGKIGERTLCCLQKKQVRISAVLVTHLNGDEERYINGVVLKEFSDEIDDSALIILAVSRQYQVEIRRKLFQANKFMVYAMP